MKQQDGTSDRSTPAPEPSIELLKQPLSEGESPSRTIHVLDQDSEVLLFLFDFLSNAGYQLSASSNVDDALDHVARSHPEALIADGDMPGWTGSELLMRVRDLSPSTRVILTSCRPDQPLKETLRAGGVQVLAKPIDGMTLLRVVQRRLAR